MQSNGDGGSNGSASEGRSRLARHLGERVPLTGSNPMAVPVMVPRWIYLLLACSAVGLFAYFLLSLARRFMG